jgi:hypothetical protein
MCKEMPVIPVDPKRIIGKRGGGGQGGGEAQRVADQKNGSVHVLIYALF